ncbi:hypothetical protein [Rhodococcus sp. BS-15]|uniref:hypothetical protein n=1 Tax=Rhodococcus sp. BS-15 TaxID=1304954 RepID=UPI000A6781B7|nr:hypothetical protein [Rhodococcus sp. BS-15]
MSTPNIETEHPKPQWRQWRIPTKIGGRVRTSTVAFGICFVLTGLLYGQVSAEVDAQNREAVQGPTAVDPRRTDAVHRAADDPAEQLGHVHHSADATATTEPEQSGGVVDGTGQQPTTTAPAATTTPFGLPLPPGIQSLIPTQPAPTSAR